MTEENKSVTANFLAKLRGVGGAKFSQPSAQQPSTQPSTTSSSSVSISAPKRDESKPKRDIQELYDFIDKYCADKEAQANQQNP